MSVTAHLTCMPPGVLSKGVLSKGHPRLSQELPPLPPPEVPIKVRRNSKRSQHTDSYQSTVISSTLNKSDTKLQPTTISIRRSLDEEDRFRRLNKHKLDADVIDEVLTIFDKVTDMQYAVCGMAALCLWGYTVKSPHHISILVPPHCSDTMASWAKTVPSFETFSGRPDVIGVAVCDGRLVRVNIRYLDAREGVWESYFDDARRMPLLGGGGAAVNVLRLSKLLNLAAVGYIEAERRELAVRENIGHDVMWILQRICHGLVHGEPEIAPLDPTDIPSVMETAFWDGFTEMFRAAPDTFAAAGLERRLQPHGRVECTSAPAEAPAASSRVSWARNPYRDGPSPAAPSGHHRPLGRSVTHAKSAVSERVRQRFETRRHSRQ